MILSPEELAYICQRVAASAGRGGAAGAVDRQVLVDLLARPEAKRAGIPLYPTLFNKIGVLLQAIPGEKPFGDLSYAVAAVLAHVVLRRQGYRLRVGAAELRELFRSAEIGFTSWQRFTRWLKEHTVRA